MKTKTFHPRPFHVSLPPSRPFGSFNIRRANLQDGSDQGQQAGHVAEDVRAAEQASDSAEDEVDNGLDGADEAVEAQGAGEGLDEAAEADHDDLQDGQEDVAWLWRCWLAGGS